MYHPVEYLIFLNRLKIDQREVQRTYFKKKTAWNIFLVNRLPKPAFLSEMTIECTFLAISIRLKFETMTARVLIDIKLYTRLKNTAGSHPWCVLNESKLHKCSSIVLVFWAWGENLVYIWWKAKKKNKMVKQTRKRNTEKYK